MAACAKELERPAKQLARLAKELARRAGELAEGAEAREKPAKGPDWVAGLRASCDRLRAGYSPKRFRSRHLVGMRG